MNVINNIIDVLLLYNFEMMIYNGKELTFKDKKGETFGYQEFTGETKEAILWIFDTITKKSKVPFTISIQNET